MKTCILVKHSLPHVDPEKPAPTWQLSEEGRQRCIPLAVQLAPYAPDVVISSTEPKAMETAERVAEYLKMPWTYTDGLHEHDRSKAGYLGKADFQKAVAAFFETPDALVFGGETAAQAQDRFSRVAHKILDEHENENVVIVAHGTVISLFVAVCAGIDPFELWQRLDLPSYVVLSRPQLEVLKTVVSI